MRNCSPTCGIGAGGTMPLAIDGALQATGLALFVFGLASRVPRNVGPLKDVTPVPITGKDFTIGGRVPVQ